MVLSIRVACRGNYDRFPFEMGFLSRIGILSMAYLHLGIDNTSAVTEHVSPRFDSAPRMRPLGKAKNCKIK